MSITPQYFEIKDVGKTIKSTKKQYVWRFILDGKNYTIEMFTSVLSGKKKILQNGQIIYFDSKFKSAFQFPFSIGKNSLNILQHGDKFELRINNQSFTHLWDNERTKRNFNYEERDQINSYQAKDYAKNYDQSVPTSSTNHRSNDLAVQPKPRHQSQHHSRSSHQQQSSNVDDLTGLDQTEIQAQIQAYEELQRKHKRDLEKKTQQQNSQSQQSNLQRVRESGSNQNNKDVKYNAYDFTTGFDHGFDKFSTNVQASGSVSSQSKPSQKATNSAQQKREESNDFDFNFGNQPQQNPPKQQIQTQQKSMPPQQQVVNNASSGSAGGDLFDLLGTSTTNANMLSQPQAETSKNALDFFNDLDFGAPQQNNNSSAQMNTVVHNQPAGSGNLDDMLSFGSPPQTNIQQQPAQTGFGLDAFGGQQQQVQQQQQPIQQQQEPVQDNKPKFMPNLAGFYTQQQNPVMNQQEMMMQQQMQQQMMMQQMMMNQFGTAMNLGGAGAGQGMGMNTGANAGGAMNMGGMGMGGANQFNTGMPAQSSGMGGLGGGWDNNQNQSYGGMGGGQQNQYMTGMPQNNNNFGGQQPFGGQQQQQQQNSYQTSIPQQNNYGGGMAMGAGVSGGAGAASTPFDLFN
eukprot:403374607